MKKKKKKITSGEKMKINKGKNVKVQVKRLAAKPDLEADRRYWFFFFFFWGIVSLTFFLCFSAVQQRHYRMLIYHRIHEQNSGVMTFYNLQRNQMKHDVFLMNKSFSTKLNGCLNCVQIMILFLFEKKKKNLIYWHQSARGGFHYLAVWI